MGKHPRYVYVVYHIKSTMERKRYFRAANAINFADKLGPEYAWCSIEYYNKNVVKMVERVNLMTGAKFMEPSNTPNYMSPASEAYWSM